MRDSGGSTSTRGEVVAALLVVALFCAVVGPVWWRRWQDGTLTDPAPRPSHASRSPHTSRTPHPGRTPHASGASQASQPGQAPQSGPASRPSTPRQPDSKAATPGRDGARHSATVLRVSDGDTLQLRIDGRPTTVRILNIDTPETHRPGSPVECLGPEAAEALSRMLPSGTRVEWVHDGRPTDRYGRTLAAVFLDGRLVAAEMAGAGWSGAVVVNRADTHYAPVAAAQAEAIAARRGLYDPTIGCTLAGQVRSSLEALAVRPTRSAAQERAQRSRLEQAVPRAQALRDRLARPDSQQGAIQRQRHPATWRHGQVQQLDAALATARGAMAS